MDYNYYDTLTLCPMANTSSPTFKRGRGISLSCQYVSEATRIHIDRD